MSTTPPSNPDPARHPEHEPAPAHEADTSLPGPPPGTTRTTDDDRVGTRRAHSRASTGPLRPLAILVMIGGLLLSIAGVITWVIVTNQLSDEEIVVAEDADYFAGDKVDGPLTAYSQADIINQHALEESGGQTYAQLEQDDPRRDTVMTASFLRASLFTSVVSFGVAAFAFGLGLLLIIIGWALMRVDRSLRSVL